MEIMILIMMGMENLIMKLKKKVIMIRLPIHSDLERMRYYYLETDYYLHFLKKKEKAMELNLEKNL